VGVAAFAQAERLFQIGTQNGICDRRRVAVMELGAELRVTSGVARLWAQTEWLKAATHLGFLAQNTSSRHFNLKGEYFSSLGRKIFLNAENIGLWRDKMCFDGSLVDEPAPASTFYHIVCAIFEANACIKVD